MRVSSRFISRVISCWTAAAVFFLWRPAAAFLRHGTKGTNLLVDLHQLLAELLEAQEFGHLPLGFAQRRRSGKTLIDRLAIHFAAHAELRLVSRIVRLGTVARGFSAGAQADGNGTGSKITQAEELLQELSAFGL